MRKWFCFVTLSRFALMVLVHAQPQPVLGPPSLDPAGILALALQGESNSNYTFEASADLSDWWPVFSTVASNGAAAFAYATDTQDGSRYFRARLNVPLPPIHLAPGLEPFPRALTLVTAEEGGSMTFTDGGGVVYTLTVPTNAVRSPQVFTMTLVPHLGALPFSAGLLGAVVIQPEGTELLAPAELTMEFPTTNLQNAAAFTFSGTGEDLRVLPAQGETNRLHILISNLGGVGASLATLSEIQQVARTYPAVQNAPPLAQNGAPAEPSVRAAAPDLGPLFFLAKCFPEQALRAREVQEQIVNGEAALLVYLLEEQQLGRNGAKTSEPYLDFFKTYIRPYTAEATGNCALNDVLARATKLLGAHAFEFGRLSLSFAPPSLCVGAANCATELKVCCGKNPSDPQAADLDLQLIQLNANNLECPISPDLLKQVQQACHPGWQGQFNYAATTHRLLVTTNSNGTEVFTNFLDYRVEAHLVSVDLQAATLAGGSHKLEGTLAGTIQGKYHSTDGSNNLLCCGNGCYSAHDEQSGIGRPFTGKFNLIWSPLPGDCTLCSVGFQSEDALTNITVIDNIDVKSRRDGDKCTEQAQHTPDSGVHGFDLLLNVPSFNPAFLPLFFGLPTAHAEATQGGTDQSTDGSITVTNTDPVDGTKDTVQVDWNFTVQN